MMSDIRVAATLAAWQDQQAMPFATALQVAIHPEALIFCPIEMAGEDTTIHACSVGTLNGPAAMLCTPDPRNRDGQYALFAELHDLLGPWAAAQLAAGTYPQLWVPSASAVTLVDTVAERIRYQSQHPAVVALGTLLTHFGDRSGVAGQQAIIAAAPALTAHWVTPQLAFEDAHLGTVIEWIKGGADVQDRVALVERLPMGVRTDPAFDERVLAPLVEVHTRLRRNGASSAEQDAVAVRIRHAMTDVLRPIHEATREAIRLLAGSGLRPISDLSEMEERETYAFRSFATARAEGKHLRREDSDIQAIHNLLEREDALQQVAAGRIRGDRVAQAEAILAGEVLAGVVIASRPGPEGTPEMVVESTQPVLRMRPGDGMMLVTDPRLRVKVVAMSATAAGARAVLTITGGQFARGLPRDGEEVIFMDEVMGWGWLPKVRQNVARRTKSGPWTHGGAIQRSLQLSRQTPADPLSVVEGIQ